LPEFSGQWCGLSSKVIIGPTTVEEWTTNLSRSVEHQWRCNVAQYHSRQDTPNTSLQNPNNSHKHVWLIFTRKCPTTRSPADGLPDISDDSVPSGYDNFTRGMVTTAFPRRFRKHVKKRKHKVKIQYEQKRLELKLWTPWRSTHNLPRRSLLSEHRTV
jgi:hypothetical protein